MARADRLEAGCRKCIHCGHQAAVYADFTLTDQRASHMRERRQIAGGANRAARRNARVDVVVDQLAEQFDEFDPHAGKAFRKRDDFHEHDEPNDIVVEILADADSMRAHQVCLQVCQFIVADTYRRELPKPVLTP